jgi:hypothetical protein
MFKRQGRRRALLGIAVGVGAVVGLLGAGVAPAQADAGAPLPVTSYAFTSAAGDPIGGGAKATYKAPDSSVTLSGTAASVVLSVRSGDDNWTVDLAAPRGDVLRPGVYQNAERASFRTGRSPGLDVYGDGRGCNDVYGQFSVNQIATDPATGAVTLLDATFTQHCDSAAAPALKGTVKYQALPLSYAFTSDAGDYIGGGRSVTYTGSTSTFDLSGTASRLGYDISGKRDDWDAIIAAPTGGQLTAGQTYTTTRSGDATDAGLDVYGDGAGCNTSTGELTVTKLVTDSSGAVTNFAATFVQHCEGGTPALHGTIHYYA